MITEMLTMGVFFWIVLIGGLIGLSILIEIDHVGWAGMLTIGLFAVFFYLVESITLDSIRVNSNEIILNVVYYLLIGIAWAFVKWYMLLKVRKNDYIDLRKTYLNYNNIEKIGSSEFDKEQFTRYLRENRFLEQCIGCRRSKIELQSRDYKDRITGWIFWWPISIILALLRDVVTWVYDHIKGVFQILSDHMFKGFKGDI